MSVVQIETVCNEGNTLKLNLIINATPSNHSRVIARSEHQLRKIIKVALKVHKYYEESIVFVNFCKIYDDEIKYALKVRCNELESNNKTYFTDAFEQYLGTLKGNRTPEPVLIEINLDIAPKENMFASLHGDSDLTDFELRAEDGAVGFHKVVLSSWSPVFRTMFSGKWKENKEGYIEIKDASKMTLQHLKDYMYNQVLPDNSVEQLLQLACCYDISELKQKCIDRLVSSVSVHNAWQLVQFAAAQDLSQLFGKLLLFLNQNTIIDIGTHYAFNPKH